MHDALLPGLRGYELPLLPCVAVVGVLVDIRAGGFLPSINIERQAAVDAGQLEVTAPDGDDIPLLVCLAVGLVLIDQSAMRLGGFVHVEHLAARLRLTELAAPVAEAFAKDEIGVGHALLLANAAKPKLIQISTAYRPTKGGSAAVPRNKYVEICKKKPTNQKQRDWPEYKTSKFTTDAIVTEGSERTKPSGFVRIPNATFITRASGSPRGAKTGNWT